MPQLNIYLDKEAEQAVWKAARRNSMSLSKWARNALLEAAKEGISWPEHYETLFGSVSDPSFEAPADSVHTLDQQAEFME